MANARSTRTEEGTPYRRQMPVFQAVEANEFGSELAQQLSRVEVVDVEKSDAPFRQVFDPGHPEMQMMMDTFNIQTWDILHEMVDLMNTSRTYEANSNVTETTYKMANQALSWEDNKTFTINNSSAIKGDHEQNTPPTIQRMTATDSGLTGSIAPTNKTEDKASRRYWKVLFKM